MSGKEGPYNTQEEANAAAEAAKNNAIAQLQTEAQAMVDAAIAEAKAQLAKSRLTTRKRLSRTVSTPRTAVLVLFLYRLTAPLLLLWQISPGRRM